MTVDEFDEALTDLETRVDRLRALYENWFRGYEKTEPAVPRKDVERRVYALRKELPRNTALRFRYHQLYLKYTTMANYWQRTARQIEEGTYRPQLQRLKRKHEREQEQEARRERRKHDRHEEDANNGPRSFELDLDESLSVDDLLDELEMEEVAKALERPGPHSAPPPAMKTPPKPAPVVASFGRSATTANSPAAGRPVAQVGAAGPAPAPTTGSLPKPPPAFGTSPGTGSLPRPPAFAGPGTGSLPKPPPAFPGPGTGSLPKPPPSPPTGARPAAPAGPASPGAATPVRPGATPARPAAAPVAPRPAPGQVTSSPRAAPAAPSGTTLGRPAPAHAAHRAPVAGSGTFVGRPPVASPLAGAPDEGRLKRIYEEYAAARRRNNEGEVRFEQMVGSIQKMLPELSKKHQGKRIDFEVVVKDGRVGLKPKAT